MTDFNGTVGSGAIKHITGMGNLAVIDDNTDSMHTGIIQYLNATAAGNHVVDGMTIAQSDGGTYTTFTVAAGSYFKNHVLQSFSEAAVSLTSSFDPAAFTYYIFLVVNSSGSLALRGNESDGASETDVGNLSDGDIPIALIEINKSLAANATDRKIQYFGATAKGRGFSVTDTNGNEVLQLKIDGTLVNSGGTLTLPSATDTLVGKATTDTLTNKTLNFAGGNGNTIQNIPNSALASSTFTISDGSNTSPVALSETLTIQGTNNEVDVVENNKTVTVGLPSTITANVTGNVTGNLTGNADSATLATKATGLNTTNNGIVKTTSGDGTISVGSLVSGDIPNNAADTSGNASTATALANARDFSITGDITASAISFDGTGAVALNATIDNNSVALGTKTTGSYVAQGATSGSGISGAVNTEGGTFTVTSNATSANTASTIVFRDSNGDFNAGTISAALTGNVTGNVTGTVSDISNHDTGDLAEGTNKYLTLANLKSQLNASMPSDALTIGDSDDTITIPGNLVVTGTTTTASVETVSTSNGVVFEGSTADNNETTLVGGNPSGDITITLPTTAGTVALTTSDISGNAATATKWASAKNITLTGDVTGVVSIDGSTNVSLATTIAGDSVALGTDTTGNYVTSITNGSFLTGGNGGSEGAALTLAVDATNLNTASKVVARDGSGNFSAGTITATLSGNASTATQAANLNNHDTGDLSEGSNLYHTTERVQDVVGGQFVTNGSHTNITAAYDDENDGAIDLSITDGTIRGKISVTDSGGDGSLAYNNGTGVITYTGPSASDVRAHFSAGTGVGISSGEISIGQAVATNSNVQFGTITGTTITGSSIVKSDGSSSEFLKADGSVDSSTYLTAHPNISGASNVSTSTGIFINGLTFDSNGHVTATSTTGALTAITPADDYITATNTNGNVTVDIDLSEFADMDVSVNKTEDELIILDNGSQKRKLISEIPISSFNNDGSALNPANFSEKTSFDHAGGAVTNEDTFIITDTDASNAGKRILASNIPLSAFDNTATGFTSNAGDITAIVSGIGLTGGNTSGSVTLALDFSELTDMTGDISGTTEFILQDGTTESRKAASEIKLSAFNNDLGITSNATHTGDVTGSTALTIADDAVTYAKMQNVSATNRILGRDTAGAGVIEEITPANLRTMINVEDGADVTDATNVAAAGALMDSEVTNLAQVKSFDSSDYATAAQGAKADSAQQPPSEGAFANGDKTKLDGIEASATADQTGAEIKTALFDETDTNNLTDTLLSKLNAIEASATADQTAAEIRTLVESASDSNVFTNADHSKLNAIEASADVTDTANVKAALGAAMPSNTLTIGDGSTAVTIPGALTVTGTITTNNVETVSTSNGVLFEGNNADNNELTLLAGTVSADRTITLPDADGTVLLTDGSGASLTSLNGSQITSGTIGQARIGVLPASKITSGTFPTARIADEAVTEAKLDVNNTAQNGYLLSWNDSASQMSWIDASTAGSSNQTITTGDGLTGANSGSASNITIAVGAGTGIDVAADAISVNVAEALNVDLGGDIVFGTQTDDNVKYTGTISVGNVNAAGSAKITADGFASMNGLYLGYGAGPGYIKTYNGSDNLELYAHSGSAHVKMLDLDAVNDKVIVGSDLSMGENKKIYFDSTDTYIYADTDSSEDLHIGADGHIELEPDNDLIVKTGSTEYVRFDGSEQRVGIGTTTPSSALHVRGSDAILTVEDTSIGIAALSRTMAGIDIISGGMNNGNSKYGTALKFLSTDGQLTTENPKFLAAIAPRATEQYGEDIDGGMALDFAITDNQPGTTNVPSVAMTIDHTGKVGIGTDTPAVNVHVSHATDPKIRVQDTTANYSSTLAGYSGGAYLAMGDMDSSENSFLLFGAFSNINNLNTKNRDFHLYGTNTTTGLYFDESAGKFGIGTTSPSDALHIRAASDHPLVIENTTNAGYAGIQFSDNSNNSYGQKGEFRFNHADGSSEGSGASFTFSTTESDLSIIGGKFIASDSSASEPGFAFAGDVNTGLFQIDSDDIALVTVGTERLTVANDGNVGIGTTTPANLLHVHHDTATSILGQADDNDALVWVAELNNLPNPQAPTTFGAGLKLSLSSGSGNELLKWAGMAAVKSPDLNYSRKVDAAFYTQTDAGNGVAPTEKMRITGDGNVGIGLTNPSTLLEVASSGTIKVGNATMSANNLTINNTGGYGAIELAGSSGGYLDIKSPSSDDYDLRLISAGTGGTIQTSGNGDLAINVGTGDVNVTASDFVISGALAATTKSFDIEHPTKEGMRLHHGSLEGPEHGVYIRGRLEGNEIDLPDYWLGLVDEDTITVQLTPNRGFQQIYVEDISDNKVYVGTQSDKPIDCFYFIQAERKDVDKMEVEY